MSKQKVFTTGVSVLGSLFLLAFIFSVGLANDSKVEFVGLSDEEMEHVEGGLDPRQLRTSSGSLALCPFLGSCSSTVQVRLHTYGSCISCSYAGQRKYGKVNNKLIETHSWCTGSPSSCHFWKLNYYNKSCEIYTTATCT